MQCKVLNAAAGRGLKSLARSLDSTAMGGDRHRHGAWHCFSVLIVLMFLGQGGTYRDPLRFKIKQSRLSKACLSPGPMVGLNMEN